MDLSLYAKVQRSARYCRNQEVRTKISLFLKVLKTGQVGQSCARFGIPVSSYYRWWKMFRGGGFQAQLLIPKSRRPQRSPRLTPPTVVAKIRSYRFRYHYGPARIAAYLRTHHQIVVCASTVRRVIERKGWILRRNRTKRKNPHQKRYELPVPGWMQLDIKYIPKQIQGKQYYEFNAIDECSRWRFARAYEKKNTACALDFVRKLVLEAPFKIERIQTDNDRAFTHRYDAYVPLKEHPFEGLLAGFGIRHRLIPPGVKELNGKVERSHRTDDEEFFWKAPYENLEAFKKGLEQWIEDYNYTRPHSSLKGLTPVEKLVQVFLVPLWVLAFRWGNLEILEEKITITKRVLGTYLKYHDWVQQDPFHFSDVRNYYI
jgi:transposase InsO family protein